jgi:type IV fimbrial biogenesis protein FimT
MSTKARGFTLVELLVTIAFAAILLALAAPSFKRTIQSNNMSSAVNTFMTDLRYARSEAIRRGGHVILCRTDAPESATPSCDTSAGTTGKGWATGWIVVHDVDGSGNWSTGDTTLRQQSAVAGIDAILEGTPSSATKFTFTATGRLSDVASAAKVKFGGSDFSTDLQRVMCVSAGGRARLAGDGSTTCGSSNE